MTQFLVPSGLQSDEVLLDGEEARHLARVHRVRPGERIRLFDGMGGIADGVIRRVTRTTVHLSISNRRTIPPPLFDIVVRPALIKQDRFELLLEKCAELGADRIAPVITERSSMNATAFQARIERFQRILRETAKQCDRPRIVALDAPVAFGAVLQQIAGGAVRIAAVLSPEAQPIRPVLDDAGAMLRRGAARSLELFSGPEGDYTENEMVALRAAGVRWVTLGSGVLRAETAAILLTGLASLSRGDLLPA